MVEATKDKKRKDSDDGLMVDDDFGNDFDDNYEDDFEKSEPNFEDSRSG